LANQLGVVGKYLARLFETSFKVAKTVRTTTEIGTHPISIAYAAVKLASHIFTDLKESTVLLIGAGELIQLTAKHLKESGVKKIWIANRTRSRAELLANLVEGEVVSFEDIPEKLYAADILITGVYSPLPILGKGMIERAIKLRKHKPMYMVDLGVPRNVEPEVLLLEDVFLYCLDDLQSIVVDNRRMRQNAAISAEKIIEREAERFMEWVHAQDSFRTIYAFRHKCEELRDQVFKEGLQRLQGGEDAERVLQRALYSLTNRFMHLPTRRLREAGIDQERQLLDLTRDLFELHYENIDTE
jgi:glutamyl-tRNA reductase